MVQVEIGGGKIFPAVLADIVVAEINIFSREFHIIPRQDVKSDQENDAGNL